jgi:hypothetical protein
LVNHDAVFTVGVPNVVAVAIGSRVKAPNADRYEGKKSDGLVVSAILCVPVSVNIAGGKDADQ